MDALEEITLPQAAQETGITHSALRRAVAAGRLPARKVGTTNVITRAALAQYRRTYRPRPNARLIAQSSKEIAQ